ncbi:MAG: family 5 extracellular solute-binding protein peptide/nickel transport system substrate-binding [Candidatus Kaiserbacteria bacterium]|nr:family 5 extracellular solute-binding protein peptide/nickel transport system substrate-binding [Candidatus Kaiserbacteria bacterium]
MDNEDSPSDSTNGVLTKPRRVSRFRAFDRLLPLFSPGERLFLYILILIFGISAFALLAGANASVSVTIPSRGGSLTEGEVGPVRFLNPVIAMSQADADLTALVYSGLTRALPDGSLVGDLAESYTISTDGMTYTFKLRPNATFQDGQALTSADVAFTVAAAQNPDIKSPLRADWEGVVVSTPDAHTVVFKLPRAYAPFIHNTTMGILPKHLWNNVSSEEFPFSPINTHPIGTGPYQVSDVQTDSTGSVTRYDLAPFRSFALGEPFVGRITLLFYPNEDAMLTAFDQGRIDAVAGIDPAVLKSIKRSDVQTITTALTRVFGVFFNQSHAAVLADPAVRGALDTAIDKQRLVEMVLSGYGVPLVGPVPPTSASGRSHTINVATAYTDDSIAAAQLILTKAGWKHDTATNTWTSAKGLSLSFTLATADPSELVATANAVATAWKALGATVAVQVYPLSDLNATVIRPRNYDAILFGEVVGRELDFFAFWHSSQRNDPGLNLALYANPQVDTLLTQARATTDTEERQKIYDQFATLVEKDRPAVFLYAPEFLYEVPKGLKGVSLDAISAPGERFYNVYQWYTDTESVWSIFTDRSPDTTL